MAPGPGYARWRLLRPFGPYQINICFSLWAHSPLLKFLSYGVKEMISVIFYISFFMLRSHYCRSTVILSVEMCFKSTGPNFCCIMFVSTRGLKNVRSILNILCAPPYPNMHRGLITLRSVITLQRIWHWNELYSVATRGERGQSKGEELGYVHTSATLISSALFTPVFQIIHACLVEMECGMVSSPAVCFDVFALKPEPPCAVGAQ